MKYVNFSNKNYRYEHVIVYSILKKAIIKHLFLFTRQNYIIYLKLFLKFGLNMKTSCGRAVASSVPALKALPVIYSDGWVAGWVGGWLAGWFNCDYIAKPQLS